MAQLEQINGCLGHLEMDSEGNILKSGGDLENQEAIATHLYQLYTKCVEHPLEPKEELKRVSVNYNEFCYLLMASCGRLYIVKKVGKLQEPASV